MFAIHTTVEPLEILEILAQRPQLVRNLAIALRQIPEAMQICKNLPPIQDALLSYLDQHSAENLD